MTNRKFKLPVAMMLLVGVAIVGYSYYSHAQGTKKTATVGPPPTQDPRFNFPVAPTTLTNAQHAELAETTARTYTVEPASLGPYTTRPEEEQKTLEQISEKIAKLAPIPAERLAHFAWMERPDSPVQFRSWGCLLQEAKRIEGGWSVRLVTMARATDSQGRHMDVLYRFVEDYTLSDDGQLRYVHGQAHPADDKPRFLMTGRSL